MRRSIVACVAAALAACAGCQGPRPAGAPEPGTTVEVNGIAADLKAGRFSFPARVAVDTHHPETPVVYLELVACSPDTREHESLVVTPIRPSDLHAVMLAAGLEPGAPGRVQWASGAATRVPATGGPVRVRLRVEGREVDPSAWVRHAATGERWEPGGWVFAGSRVATRQGREVYDADGAGTVIGLASFGSEVIAPMMTVSPESAVDEPVWIADRDAVPPIGTEVTVIIEAVR